MTNKKVCYYCGAKAVSKEHAPPKQMFKGFDCDSITVPSCDEHNSEKGGQDQAIVSALLLPLANDPIFYSLERDVLDAIWEASSSFESTKRRAINSSMFADPPEPLEDLPNISYLTSSINIKEWIKQLTAALVFNAGKYFDPSIKWSEAVVWSPDWFPAEAPHSLEAEEVIVAAFEKKNAQLICEQLDWREGWSAFPRPYPKTIYSFQVHISLDNIVVFRHRFYDQYSWYTFFSVPKEVVTTLKKKLG